MLSKSQDLTNYKKTYKKDGIIKLDFFDKSLLYEFREYILLKFKRNFNLKDNLAENKLSECEKTNNALWSGIFKNILLTEPFYSLVMRSFELPFKEGKRRSGSSKTFMSYSLNYAILGYHYFLSLLKNYLKKKLKAFGI